MKKIYVMAFLFSVLAAACSNSNTVNVPADSANVPMPVPHDTASNMRDSAKHADTSVQH